MLTYGWGAVRAAVSRRATGAGDGGGGVDARCEGKTRARVLPSRTLLRAQRWPKAARLRARERTLAARESDAVCDALRGVWSEADRVDAEGRRGATATACRGAGERKDALILMVWIP